MKILMVVKTLAHFGGVERHVSKVSSELASRGHEITLLTSAELLDLPFPKVLIADAGDGSGWQWTLHNLGFLDEFDALVIHDFYPAVFWLWPWLVGRRGKPVLLLRHGHEGVWPIPDFYRRLHWLAYDGASANIAIGDWIPEVYGPPADKVMYGAVDAALPPTGLPAPRLTFAGRLEPDTDIRMLVEALALLKQRHGVLLPTDIYGDGSLRSELEALVQQAGIPVSFHGPVPDPRVKMEATRFVYATGYLSIWEALAAGKVVLAGFSTELKRRYLACMPPCKAGLVQSFGSVEALVEGLRSALVGSDSDQLRLAREGYRFAAEYSWKVVADQYETLLTGCKRVEPSEEGMWGLLSVLQQFQHGGLTPETAQDMVDHMVQADNLYGHLTRAGLLRIAGQSIQALQELDLAIAHYGVSAPVLYLMADLFLQNSLVVTAAEALKKARELSPATPQIAYLLAVALEKLDPDKACQEYAATLALDPTHAYAHLRLGLLQVMADSQEGLTHLETAWRIAPGLTEAAVQLAQALHKFGRHEEMCAVLDRMDSNTRSDDRVRALLNSVVRGRLDA
jgi:glycosyltransferase involved in cell wall biosynthesis